MLPTAGNGRDPHLGVAAAHLVAQLCFPAELSLPLPGVGVLTVRPRLLDRTATPDGPAGGSANGEALALDWGGEPGRLVLEARLAVGLVNAVLGLAPPPFAGPLTRIERGVLAGLVGTLVAGLGLTPGVTVGGQARWDCWSTVIAFSAALRADLGHGWLVMSDGCFERACRACRPRSALAPRLELAATDVGEAELVAAMPGDQLVFDGTAALAPDDSWPVRLCWGANQAAAWWLPDGGLVPRDDLVGADVAAATRLEGVRDVGRQLGAPAGRRTAHVVAECACPASNIFPPDTLMVPRNLPVSLKANGRPIAQGDIGECDGTLAVTIRRKLEA